MFVSPVRLPAMLVPAVQLPTFFHFAHSPVAMLFVFEGSEAFAHLFPFVLFREKLALVLVPVVFVLKEVFAFPIVQRSKPVAIALNLLSSKNHTANVAQQVVLPIRHLSGYPDT